MADETVKESLVDAPLTKVFDAIVDFEAYPSWANDLTSVQVLERDSNNKPVVVAFSATALGRSTKYVLKYDWSNAPNSIAWHQVKADVTTKLEGSYELEEQQGNTKITYRLSVGLSGPVPGFIRRQLESKIINTALVELKNFVEKKQSPDV